MEKHSSGRGERGNPSVCSKVVFIKKQPIIAKALFWHLRVLCRGCVCIYSVTSMTTLMLISDRPLTLKITSTHTAGYKFSLLNCSQISWILTNTPPPAHKLALKIPVLIFNFLKKTPKHKYLSIYSDEWHLKPTGLAVHYKHSSSSLVLTKKLLTDKLPGLFANWSQILILEHPNLQVKSTKQNQLGGISIFFRQYWKMFPNSLY